MDGIVISIIVLVIALIVFKIVNAAENHKRQSEECLKGNHEFADYISKWMIKPSATERITGVDYYDAWSWRYQGFKFKKVNTRCKHCNFLKETQWIKIGEFNGMSASSDTMDEYEEHGIVEWS